MGRRSNNVVQSELNLDTIENDTVSDYNWDELRRVQSVQSQFPARIIITGQASGKQYVWEKAGDTVDVDSRDLDWLLTKRVGRGACCGGSQFSNLLFRLVEE